jgi:hypothetical protein
MATLEHNNYDCVFVNGDSYSDPISGNSYGNFLGEYFGVPVENFALRGSNNDRILRSTIEYMHSIQKKYKNPLVIIGWSFIRRIEVWYYGNYQKIIQKIPDSNQSRLITLDNIFYEGMATLEQKALINSDMNVHKQLTDFYTKLYLFGKLVESLDWDYLCFSAAKNTDCPIDCFPYINSLNQVQWVDQNTNFYQLHNFCIQDWAFENDQDCKPETGHLSESGHKKFSKYILRNMLQHA